MTRPPAKAKPTPAAAPNIGVLQDVIGFRIRRIQNHLSRSFTALVAKFNIQPGTFSALALIQANPGISQTELSDLIGYDRASVVMIVDLLERLKWAERRRAPVDRRKHSLYLTRAGVQACARLRALALKNEKLIHARLSDRELAELSRLLDKLYLGLHDAG